MVATSSDASAGADSARFADLKTRIISGVAAAAVGLTLIWLGGIWTLLLIAFITGGMIWELRSVTLHRGGACGLDVAFPLVAVVGAVLVAQLYSFPAGCFWLGWALAGGAAADLAAGERRVVLWGVLGSACIGAAGIGFLYIRLMDPHGFSVLLLIILVVAAADIGGYFAGRRIGGPKLWPRISPKKTWAGIGGGIGLAVAAGAVFSVAVPDVDLVSICVISAVAAVLSQCGDLAESAVKRHFGVKDSGRLLPGHGGLLDRFDGLIAVVLAASLATWWRGQTVLTW